MNKNISTKNTLPRRNFLRTTLLGGAGLLILPNSRTAFAYEANSKLNVAAIGVGGRGRSNLRGCLINEFRVFPGVRA